MFSGELTYFQDEKHWGRPSAVTDALKSRVEEKIKEDRHFTIQF